MRQTIAAIRMLIVLTVITGVVYPLAIWGVGQAAFRNQAAGSLIRRDGHVIASSLIGQDFKGKEWFHGRPSASGYDGLASGASNLGPENPDLVAAIEKRRVDVATLEGVDPADVPPDAVTASGSGLDPYISPEYAALQVERVAGTRGLSVSQVEALVDDATSGRAWGFLGEPRVNVVTLNVALGDMPQS